jgi:hypothetical protein
MPMDSGTVRIRPGDATGSIVDRGRPRPRNGAAILILGSCRDDAFVADQILVAAGTLEAETAIRRWLREHDIRLAASLRSVLSTDGRGPR